MDAIKYPRTQHLPWSQTIAADDLRAVSTEMFIGKDVVVTEKMDGENTTMSRELCHARSINSGRHESRSWVKAFWQGIRYQIPEGWRVCGENLYAKHSIAYNSLMSFFYCFSVWNEKNEALSWQDTVEFCKTFNIVTVPVLWTGTYDEEAIKSIKLDTERQEGYVIRNSGSFKYEEFSNNVAKFVRANHVQSDTHWMNSKIVPNSVRL